MMALQITQYNTGDDHAVAEVVFNNAIQIAGGGLPEARHYAEMWHTHFRPSYWENALPDQQDAIVSRMASGALACAKAIMADGRAHYIDSSNGQDMLVVCTLVPDGSAGAVGFLPLTEIN